MATILIHDNLLAQFGLKFAEELNKKGFITQAAIIRVVVDQNTIANVMDALQALHSSVRHVAIVYFGHGSMAATRLNFGGQFNDIALINVLQHGPQRTATVFLGMCDSTNGDFAFRQYSQDVHREFPCNLPGLRLRQTQPPFIYVCRFGMEVGENIIDAERNVVNVPEAFTLTPDFLIKTVKYTDFKKTKSDFTENANLSFHVPKPVLAKIRFTPNGGAFYLE